MDAVKVLNDDSGCIERERGGGGREGREGGREGGREEEQKGMGM